MNIHDEFINQVNYSLDNSLRVMNNTITQSWPSEHCYCCSHLTIQADYLTRQHLHTCVCVCDTTVNHTSLASAVLSHHPRQSEWTKKMSFFFSRTSKKLIFTKKRKTNDILRVGWMRPRNTDFHTEIWENGRGNCLCVSAVSQKHGTAG